MRSLNLGFFRKVLLSVLVGMIHFVYHTDANGYYKYTNTSNASACVSYCGNSTYYKALYATDILSHAGIVGSNTAQMYNVLPTAWSTTMCLCLTSTEYNSVATCRAKSCGAYVSGPTGAIASGSAMYNYVTGACTGVHCTCNSAGYYKYNSGYCSNCRPGYYCQGINSTACPAGRYTSVATQSTCTPCAKGYYVSYSGASQCLRCPSGGIGSTTLYGTTSYTGTTNSIMNCYIAEGSSFSDLTGSGHVTPLCYYS